MSDENEIIYFICESAKACGNDRCDKPHRYPHEPGINCTEEICDYDEKSKCIPWDGCKGCKNPQNNRVTNLCTDTDCEDYHYNKRKPSVEEEQR